MTRRRVVAFGVLAVLFAAWWRTIGLPTDITAALGWLWAATICWNVRLAPREQLRFARDWLPVAAALIAYDVSRGLADTGSTPHVTGMMAADRALFGGALPAVWLQRHLYDPAAVRWYDVLASWVYFSHFVVVPVIAVVLWLRSRPMWTAFIVRWLILTALGLATYFCYPAAPPWWAAAHGMTPPVARISARGWHDLGLHGAGNLITHGQALANPVAAMPSLHAAFALFAVAFFARRVRRRWLPLLAAYPVAMAVTLVYTGEHWAIDVLAGWAYAAAALVGARVLGAAAGRSGGGRQGGRRGGRQGDGER